MNLSKIQSSFVFQIALCLEYISKYEQELDLLTTTEISVIDIIKENPHLWKETIRQILAEIKNKPNLKDYMKSKQYLLTMMNLKTNSLNWILLEIKRYLISSIFSVSIIQYKTNHWRFNQITKLYPNVKPLHLLISMLIWIYQLHLSMNKD